MTVTEHTLYHTPQNSGRSHRGETVSSVEEDENRSVGASTPGDTLRSFVRELSMQVRACTPRRRLWWHGRSPDPVARRLVLTFPRSHVLSVLAPSRSRQRRALPRVCTVRSACWSSSRIVCVACRRARWRRQPRGPPAFQMFPTRRSSSWPWQNFRTRSMTRKRS